MNNIELINIVKTKNNDQILSEIKLKIVFNFTFGGEGTSG
jgi:hypothetical protein